MHLPFERDRSLIAVVVAVLLLSLGVGFAADQVSLRRKSAVERAEALAQNGRFEAAEGVYLELLATRPGDVPLLVAMLDNHDSWLRAASEQSRELLGEEEPTLARSVPVIDESRVDSAFAAPSLSGDARMLVQWWRHVLASTDEPGEREEVVKAATRTPPSPWANRLLGRADDRRGRFAEAAESFAREASAFADRSDDAAAACHIWIDTDDWERLSLALSDERFAQQVPATVHMEEAIHRQAWPAVLRWFFAAQYEKTSLAIVLLVAVSGLVWFVVCALVGVCRSARDFVFRSSSPHWLSGWQART